MALIQVYPTVTIGSKSFAGAYCRKFLQQSQVPNEKHGKGWDPPHVRRQLSRRWDPPCVATEQQGFLRCCRGFAPSQDCLYWFLLPPLISLARVLAMFLWQAAGFLRRLRFPLAAPINATLFSSVARSCETKFLPESRLRFSSWTEHQRDFAVWIFLSGHAGIILGISSCYAMAEDKSVDGSFNENGAGEAFLTGLRRIDDGSVVSNEHTSKWRIFTDNGRDQFQKGKLHEAEKYFFLALKEAKEGFGERDPHVASAYNNLAELYRVRKAFDKAEPLYLEAINILEESFGPDDIRVGAALHNLGQFYLGQRKLEEARICYERALKIKGRVLGLGHPDYANTMYHLGTVLNLQGKEKDAEALIQDSIRILEEAGLGESVTCIRRMRYLSQVYLKSNKVAEAENLQRKILHVLELSKGWDSLETVNAAEGLALTLLSAGNLKEAHELLDRCLKVRKKILHDNHIQVGATMLHLARVAMLNSNKLRKINASEASIELDEAKCLLDNSIRIARSVIDNAKENKSEGQSNGEAHAALVILLQSLDSLALLEITRCELQESKEANTTALEAQRALRQCISILKEPGVRTWALQLPDVKAEYLSCLRRLLSLLDESNADDVRELKEEIRSMEADLFSSKNRKNRR